MALRLVFVAALLAGAGALRVYQNSLSSGPEEGCSASPRGADVWRQKHRQSLKEALDEQVIEQQAAPPTKIKKILYINSDSQKARDQRMKEHLNKEAGGIPWERVPAMIATEDESRKYSTGKEHKCIEKYSEAEKKTIKATWVSHVNAMNHVQDVDLVDQKGSMYSSQPYLILEDDAVLQPGWQQHLQTIMRSAPAWDMIQVGYGGKRICQDRITRHVFEKRRVNDPDYAGCNAKDEEFYSGMTGYLVKPSSVQALLNYLSHKDLQKIDSALVSKGRTRDNNGCIKDPKGPVCIRVYSADLSVMAVKAMP